MDLADRLIEKTKEVIQEESDGGQTYVDDLGIPTVVADKNNPEELKTNVDYYVARIIKNNEDRVADNKQGRLYRRNNMIFIGKDVVIRSDNNLMRLCKPQWNIPAYIKPQVWDRLYDLLPDFSYDKIVITPHMAFNKETGELEWLDKPFNTTGKGGING